MAPSTTSVSPRAILRWLLLVVLASFHDRLHDRVAVKANEEDEICDAEVENQRQEWRTGTLRPADLPRPMLFRDFTHNYTVSLPSGAYQVAEGSVLQINRILNDTTRVQDGAPSEVSLIKHVLPQDTVDSMLQLLRAYQRFDEDPDSVDGMPTYEMFLDSDDLGKPGSPKVIDTGANPEALRERTALREQLRSLTRRALNETITPFVRQRYPDICLGDDPERHCTPCYSLIRRYRDTDRCSHATHHDGHALATVVISLSEYGQDYTGGLYVSTGYGQRAYLGHNKGDAAVHRSNLLHGVQVYPAANSSTGTAERWSWILWYRDSVTCHDHSGEWFAACSASGNALCQQLHATKVGLLGLSAADEMETVVRLNRAAAQGGAGAAAVKMARAYLHSLPSNLPFNEQEAVKYFRMATASHNPEGHYGLAHLYIQRVAKADQHNNQVTDVGWRQKEIRKAVWHLEQAAMLGHAYSMFNLGMVHVYGYGVPVDMELGVAWFVKSGLPEGYWVAAHHAEAIGNTGLQDEYKRNADALGFSAPWRKMARQKTGSGGAGGVDLNLPWPISSARGGIRPPVF